MHNMRAALTHLQDHGAVDDEVRLAALISDVVESVSFDETERICRHALSRQPAPSQHVFDFYQLLGLLYHYAGRHEESRRQHHAALELARRLGRNDLLTQAAIGRGWEAETVDELESLAREAEQAL